MTWLIGAFLIAHGAVHLAIWLPASPMEADHHAPFTPDHSAVLTKSQVPRAASHVVAVALAGSATVAYVAAGLAVLLGSGWGVVLAAFAAGVGLALKLLFFSPWLSLGVLLDAAVLSSALLGWPTDLA